MDEFCAYQPGDNAPVSRFDNYKWRGPHLSHVSFFEYCMLIQTKPIGEATTADVNFDPRHLKSGRFVQRLAKMKSQVATVTFTGQFSEFQIEEESVTGGNPLTMAMRIDLAEVLLGLFVPWDQLPPLFQQYGVNYEEKRSACANIWMLVQRTLSPHSRNYASNIELLRKSREEC
jgi:hypothetical protein